MKIILLATLLLITSCIYAQDNLMIENKWQGMWTAQDTGLSISATAITRLYNDDGNWSVSSFEKDRFQFIDSLIHIGKNKIEGWVYSTYTSMRLYHKNEAKGETSIETVECKYIRLELINANSMRISISKRFKSNQENKLPAIVVTKGMKEEVEKMGWVDSIILQKEK